MKTKLISFLFAARDRLAPVLYTLVALGLRLLFGWQFFLTGKGKLAHLDRTTEFFASIHIPAPGAHAVLIGLLELVGGLLLIAGVGTRLISLALGSTMIVAYLTAHRAEAFADIDAFMAAAPFPFLVATLVLAAAGPGCLSLDTILARKLGKGACPTAKS